MATIPSNTRSFGGITDWRTAAYNVGVLAALASSIMIALKINGAWALSGVLMALSALGVWLHKQACANTVTLDDTGITLTTVNGATFVDVAKILVATGFYAGRNSALYALATTEPVGRFKRKIAWGKFYATGLPAKATNVHVVTVFKLSSVKENRALVVALDDYFLEHAVPRTEAAAKLALIEKRRRDNSKMDKGGKP